MQGDQNTEETWERCIAEVKILASDAQECSNIAQKVLSSEIVYPEEHGVLVEVLGAMSKVKENVKRIESVKLPLTKFMKIDQKLEF